MPLWLRRSLVVLISIFTFGMVSPAQANEFLSVESQKDGNKADVVRAPSLESENFIIENELNTEKVIENILAEAEVKSFEKFGSRIGPVIENEFRQVILPNIEEAITSFAAKFPEEDLSSLSISEVPSSGNTEKIFHITGKDDEDLIRFHVRKDRPPLEGYWFNFHYHTYHDQFQNHYELGTIFWAKNTPPKWRT